MRPAFAVLTGLFVLLIVVILLDAQEHGEISEFYRQALLLTAGAILLSFLLPPERATASKVALAGVTLLLSIVSVPFGPYLAPRVLMLLVVAVAAAVTRERILLYAVLATHLLWQLLAAGHKTPWPEAPGTTGTEDILALIGVGALMAYVIERDMRHTAAAQEAQGTIESLSKTVENLSAANLGYSTFAQLARHQALLEERNRITREIHDGVGYTLTNIIMLSEAARSSWESGEETVPSSLQTIRQQAKTGLFDTRRALRLMRQAEEGLPRGLEALRQLLQIYSRATGVSATLEALAPKSDIEDSTVFLTLYRFVQEALTNSFRHGEATEVSVRITKVDGWLYVTVRDNGHGSPEVEEGIGIQGMRERVEFLGGEVTYAGEHGFVVTATLPLHTSMGKDGAIDESAYSPGR